MRCSFGSSTILPRQTDLFATYGADRYLIEAKWEQQPVGTPEVDDIRVRLDRTEGSVTGLIFSVVGYRTKAIDQIGGRRDRSILLFGDGELFRVLKDPKELLLLELVS